MQGHQELVCLVHDAEEAIFRAVPRKRGFAHGLHQD